MVELLKKFANEGIELSILMASDGNMRIKLTHGENITYKLADINELSQVSDPDANLIALMSKAYKNLKDFEAECDDL